MNARMNSNYVSMKCPGFMGSPVANYKKIKYLIFAIAVVILISISSFVIVNASERNSHKTMNKYYTSISIDSDDTLWDIAQVYKAGNESTAQYINSIKKLNNMSSDTIYNGNNLLVYYYVAEEE